MKYCIYCNNPIDDHATYCNHCGKPQAGMGMPPKPVKQSNNNILYLIIGILGTAVLLIGGYLAYNLLSGKSTEEQTVVRDTIVTTVAPAKETTVTEPVAPPPPPKVYTVQGNHHMSGAISKYGVTMDIDVNGTEVYGTYYYHSVGSRNRMTVSGNIYGNNMYLEEYSPDGYNTGCFSGTFNGRVFKGRFTNYDKGSNLSFSITEK